MDDSTFSWQMNHLDVFHAESKPTGNRAIDFNLIARLHERNTIPPPSYLSALATRSTESASSSSMYPNPSRSAESIPPTH